jgi:hypothetical protein
MAETAAYLLHENSDVQCLHQGDAKTTKADLHVKVSGHKIVTQANPHRIEGCKLPTQSGGPCVTAMWTKAAKHIKASRKPVLLKDSQASCTPTGTGVNILSTQTHVKGI